MAKPEWGMKRKCLGCGAFFYDRRLKKWTCPKCGKEMTLADFKEVLSTPIKNSAPLNMDEADEETLINTVVKDDLFETSDDDNLDILEDASDLSDDKHDMAEVMENVSIDDKEL